MKDPHVHFEKVNQISNSLTTLEAMPLLLDLSDVKLKVEELRKCADNVKRFLDEEMKYFTKLHQLWGRFETYARHAEEIFMEPTEVSDY